MRERRGGRARVRPPFCMARRGAVEIEREEVNWAAVRAEYMAGGVSQVALAKKHGVSVYAVRKRAGTENWTAKARDAGPGIDDKNREGGEARAADVEAVGGVGGDVQAAGPVSAGSDAQAARRTRMALLQMLERAAAAIPCDATEVKTTGNGGEVRLLKLRDLTAAYKELAGDLPAGEAGADNRVVIDV